MCAGASGAITKIWHGKQRRVLEGLPSIAAQGSPATPESPEVLAGSDALGPHDISFSGFSAYFPVGLGGDPALRDDQLGELGPEFGQLYKASPFGGCVPWPTSPRSRRPRNPDEEAELNSNPDSVLARPVASTWWMPEANDLLRVGPTGRIRTLAVFPPRLVDAGADPGPIRARVPDERCPTAVVRGPDHALYVSQLTGFPFPAVPRTSIASSARRGAMRSTRRASRT